MSPEVCVIFDSAFRATGWLNCTDKVQATIRFFQAYSRTAWFPLHSDAFLALKDKLGF